MPAPAPVRFLHGGASRVLALAARSLRYGSGLVAVVDGVAGAEGAMRVVTQVGDTALLLATAAEVCAGRRPPVDAPGVAAVPLLDPAAGTRVVGALCLGEPSESHDPRGAAEALAEFAAVLSEQLDLLHQLGPPPDTGAVARLGRALDDGELQAWFQPIVRLQDEALVGFEALARWRDADGEVARPGDFVPLAEQAGLVGRLDQAVLRDAVAHLARWQVGHPGLRLSVNLSGRHLDDAGWLEEVHEVVHAAGVDPATIELELTETARPVDVLRSAAQLQRARDLGYEVWLDDFGTGWSALRHLVELPVDGVKVDRFFTEALGGRGDAVVRSVVQVADDLGLDVVIEGVSQAAHAERARTLGCRLAQGFLWSPAVPPAVAERLLEAGAPLTRSGG